MSRCFCCGKQLTGNGQHHPKCLKLLFKNGRLPSIPFGLADLPAQVSKTGGRMSISGVQMKLSVRVNPESFEIETVAEGGTHILKPGSNTFPELPQNENLCMNLASEIELSVPPHGLFHMADGNLCYIIKRFDRLEDGTKMHKETLYQILNADEKYRGSLEQVGKIIRLHTYNVGLDSIDFFERVLLSFLIGNGDMHLKNWALLTRDEGKAELAPCYDFVSSKIYIQDEEDSALSINGRKNKLRHVDFEVLADSLKMDPKVAENSFRKLYKAKDQIIEMTMHSELSVEWQQKLLDVINSRYERFEAV
jgi:serine/threonine-protein kinase HipA